jgi:hypothetical protein
MTPDALDREIARLRFAVELEERMRTSRGQKSMLVIRWFCYAALAQIVLVEIVKVVW